MAKVKELIVMGTSSPFEAAEKLADTKAKEDKVSGVEPRTDEIDAAKAAEAASDKELKKVGAPEKPVEPAVEKKTPERSNYALVALSFKKDGVLPGDIEVPDDLDAAGFKELAKTAALKQAEAEAEKISAKKLRELEEAYDGDVLEFGKYLKSGGSPVVVSNYVKLKSLGSAEVKTQEDAEFIVREWLKIEGNRAELIDSHINNIPDEDAMIEESKKAQEEINRLADEAWEEEKAVEAARVKKVETDIEKIQNDLRDIIFADKDIHGIKIPASDRDAFAKYVTDRSETVEYTDHAGKTRERAVTADEKRMAESPTKMEDYLVAAYMRYKGYNKIVEDLQVSVEDEYLKGVKAVRASEDSDDADEKRLPNILSKEIRNVVAELRF